MSERTATNPLSPKDRFVADFIAAAASTMHTFAAVPEKPLKSYVVDRRGARVAPRWDEITRRIEELCSSPEFGRPLNDIDAPLITKHVVQRFRNGMTTRELDALIVQLCSSNGDMSDDWLTLAARICVSDLHKRSVHSLEKTYDALLKAAPDRVGAQLSPEHIGIVRRFSKEIDARLRPERDYRFNIFGFQTLARSRRTETGG